MTFCIFPSKTGNKIHACATFRTKLAKKMVKNAFLCHTMLCLMIKGIIGNSRFLKNLLIGTEYRAIHPVVTRKKRTKATMH